MVETRDGSAQTCRVVRGGWEGDQKTHGEVTLFFHQGTLLSNFYPSSFVGPTCTVFNGSEQYYQSAKAEAAGDEQAYHPIMAMSDPSQKKKWSYQIVGLDLSIWREEYGLTILAEGCLRKFEQCEDLEDHLIHTTGEVIAEASRYDTYYGIGPNKEPSTRLSIP